MLMICCIVYTRIVQAQYMVMDLLTFYIPIHGYQLKSFLMKNMLFETIISFLNHPNKQLRLCISHLSLVVDSIACIIFYKECLIQKTEWYTNFILKKNYLLQLMDYVNEHFSEHDMVVCSICELFLCIEKGNSEKLKKYVSMNQDHISSLLTVNPFHSLLQSYERQLMTFDSSYVQILLFLFP